MCQFLLYSKVTQSYICTYILFDMIFHHDLSQETGYSCLCCTVGPQCLSILNVMVCIYYPQTPNSSHSLPLGNHKSLLYACESVSVLYTGSFVPYFRFYIYIIMWIFFFFRAAAAACGSSQARGQIRAVDAALHQSHSNAGSQQHLQPTPWLTATPDP